MKVSQHPAKVAKASMASLNGLETEEQPQLQWPPDILTRVLQLVPQQKRLSSCALVSHAWQAAAVAATSSIVICGATSDSLYDWLERHGPVLRSITVTRGAWWAGPDSASCNTQPAQILRLPFKRLVALQSLNAYHLDRLTSGQSSVATVGDLTTLTALWLSNIRMGHLSDSLGCMSNLTTLKKLQLMDVWQTKENWQFVATSVSQLTQLTYLELSQDSSWQQSFVQGGGLQVLSLTNLQQLSRLVTCNLGYAALSELPQSITGLTSYCTGTEKPLVQLTALQQLSRLDQLFLGGFTLDVEGAENVLLQLTRLQQLILNSVNDTGPGGLKTLAKLRQLKRLYLWGYQLRGLPDVDGQASCHICKNFTSKAPPPDVHMQLKAYLQQLQQDGWPP